MDRKLADKLEKAGPFKCLTRGTDIPVLAFRIKEGADTNYSVFNLSEILRDRGWLIPAYTMPENCPDLAVLRLVVKESFSRDMADLLLGDLDRILKIYESQPGHTAKDVKTKGKVRC